jgi:hypothetical protein
MSDLIFGYTWDQIQAAQQGESLGQIVPLQAKMAKDDICTANDLELLEKHGIDGLIKKQFHGVLDRLERAGVYSPKIEQTPEPKRIEQMPALCINEDCGWKGFLGDCPSGWEHESLETAKYKVALCPICREEVEI